MEVEDGYPNYLVEKGTFFTRPEGIPLLMDLHNTEIPKDIIPFDKAKTCKNKRQYVHFYMYDQKFAKFLKNVDKYIDMLQLYDGVITPDCTLLAGQLPCLQQSNTFINRAVGVYLQRHHIPVIPNIRWSDKDSFSYCFKGVPKNMIVSVSTLGCIRSKEEKEMFKKGLKQTIKRINPPKILVHGYMPDEVFGDFDQNLFKRYPSEIEKAHSK